MANNMFSLMPRSDPNASPYNWRDTLLGLGVGLMGAPNIGQGASQGLLLANQFAGQRRAERRQDTRDQREQAIYEFQVKDAQDKAAAAEAAKKGYAEWLAPMFDTDPTNDIPGMTKQMAMFMRNMPPETGYEVAAPFMIPKPTGPESAQGKLAADLKNGLIDKATYDALLKKETYIAPQQPPQSPERVLLALEAGLKPGTPEYTQFLLGRDDTPAGPFQGTGLDQQMYNIVLTGTKSGDTSTPEYAAAYAQLAMPKVTFDPVTQKMVSVAPDMSWARQPAGAATQAPPGAPPSAAAPPSAMDAAPAQPSQSNVETMQLPGATVTSTPGKPIYNDSQGKAAGFADRMAAANAEFDNAEISSAGTDILQSGASAIPYVGNFLISGSRQKFEQAERNFINAQLRRESGAVISPTEFSDARKQYIPQPGDGPEVLAQKKANRLQNIESMKRESGPYYKPGDNPNAPIILERGPDGNLRPKQ